MSEKKPFRGISQNGLIEGADSGIREKQRSHRFYFLLNVVLFQ